MPQGIGVITNPNQNFYDWVKKNKGFDPQQSLSNTAFGGGDFTSAAQNWYWDEYGASQIQDTTMKRYSDITNFQSPFYAQYRKYLQSMLPGIGTNAMLAPLMAGNVDYGTAQKLGVMRGQEMQRQQTEAVNKGVMGFGLEMQGQGNQLLGQTASNQFNLMNYNENKRQFNEQLKASKEAQSASLWENIGLGALGFGAMFIPGMQGAGAGMMAKSVYGGASGGGRK